MTDEFYYDASSSSASAVEIARHERMQRERWEATEELDRLFREANKSKGVQAVSELISWMASVRDYSMFNMWLARLQRPGCAAIATRKRWAQLGRTIKTTAVPIVILRPMGPIMPVYEVGDTLGDPLPKSVFAVDGKVSEADLNRLAKRVRADGIDVKRLPLGQHLAGDARSGHRDQLPTDFLVRLNDNHEISAQFGTLCHELAHIYCGHCGKPRAESWWLDRHDVPLSEREFEAEGALHLVLARAGLRSQSSEYLSAYAHECDIDKISIDTIIRAANRIEAHWQPKWLREIGKQLNEEL